MKKGINKVYDSQSLHDIPAHNRPKTSQKMVRFNLNSLPGSEDYIHYSSIYSSILFEQNERNIKNSILKRPKSAKNVHKVGLGRTKKCCSCSIF